MSDYLLDGGIMSIPDFYNSLNPTEQELFNRYKINHTDDDPAFTYDLNRYLRTPSGPKKYQTAIAGLDALVTKWTNPERIELFRATIEQDVAPFIAGNSLLYPAFMSTNRQRFHSEAL